ncbi:MAG TPA: IclR family transcriptional regulator [Candidatus Acidoferrales bacterium]|jgi:DNA-binding IclR family transcriptional regulator
MPHSKTSSSVYKLQVMDRALAILDVLGAANTDSSLPELCVALNLHKSTLHRLMMVLESHRLVDKNPDTGRYRLGLKLFELGSKAIASLDLRELALPHLTRVQHETEETVNFAMMDKGEVLYIAKIEPKRNLRIAAHVGHRFPAYCTSLGKAMLAELPEAEVDAILSGCEMKARTPNTITSPVILKEELRMIRSRGYAIDDEENDEGARCIGVAVRNQYGNPVAAISASGPASRVTKSEVPRIAEVLMRSAEALSKELGYNSKNLAAVGGAKG